MELTPQDIQFIKALKAQGVSKEETFRRLNTQKEKAMMAAAPQTQRAVAEMIKTAPGVREEFDKQTEIFASQPKKTSPVVDYVQDVREDVASGEMQERLENPAMVGVMAGQTVKKRSELEERDKELLKDVFSGNNPLSKYLVESQELRKGRNEAIDQGAESGDLNKLEEIALRAGSAGLSAIETTGGALAGAFMTLAEPAVKVAMKVPLPIPLQTADGTQMTSSLEEIFAKVGDDIPDSAKEYAVTKMNDFAKWKESQHPMVQQALDEAGFLTKMGLDLIGVEALSRMATKETAAQLGKAGTQLKDDLVAGMSKVKEADIKVRQGMAAEREAMINQLRAESQTKAVKKITDTIDKEINSFIDSKASLKRTVDLYKNKKKTDVIKVIKDPDVFKGIVPDNTGSVNVDEAIAILQNRIDTAMTYKREILPIADKYVKPVAKTELRDEAIKNITAKKITPLQVERAINSIDNELSRLPDEFNLQTLDDYRAAFYNSARDARGIQKPDSHFSALENAARDLIFTKTDNLPIATSGEFAELNKFIKDNVTTIEFLNKTLKGQAIKNRNLGLLINRTVGAIAGSAGGPIGSIVGAGAADLATKIIMSRQLGGAVKKRIIQEMFADSPEVLKRAEALIDDISRYTPKELPAANGGFRSVTSSSDAIELPSQLQSTLDAMEISLADKNKLRQAFIDATKISDRKRLPAPTSDFQSVPMPLPKESPNRFYGDVEIPNPNIKRPPDFKKAAKPQTKIKPELQPLYEEARKYKSAEEFAEATITGEGVVQLNSGKLNILGKKSAAIEDRLFDLAGKDKTPAIVREGDTLVKELNALKSEMDKLTDEGDVFKIVSGGKGLDYFDRSKTKSQLEDIWKKANKKR